MQKRAETNQPLTWLLEKAVHNWRSVLRLCPDMIPYRSPGPGLCKSPWQTARHLHKLADKDALEVCPPFEFVFPPRCSPWTGPIDLVSWPLSWSFFHSVPSSPSLLSFVLSFVLARSRVTPLWDRKEKGKKNGNAPLIDNSARWQPREFVYRRDGKGWSQLERLAKPCATFCHFEVGSRHLLNSYWHESSAIVFFLEKFRFREILFPHAPREVKKWLETIDATIECSMSLLG